MLSSRSTRGVMRSSHCFPIRQLTGIVNFDILSQDTYFTKAHGAVIQVASVRLLMVGNAEVGQYMAGGWLEHWIST